METNVKIVITGIGELEVDKIEGFGINYSIDDVRKVDVKNSNYTKTVILPGTKSNNILMGNLFNINTDFTFFNPNAKTEGYILVNDTIVLSGFFQLKAIKKIAQSDSEGNIIQYDCLFFDDTISLLDRIGERKLTDLDLSAYNHRWNETEIMRTWGVPVDTLLRPQANGSTIYFGDPNEATAFGSGYFEQQYFRESHKWTNGYVYPCFFRGNTTDKNLLNDGQRDYHTEDFYPSIFNKFYIYKIAQEAGLELGGSFWDNSPSTFENEIIPYNGDIPTYDDAVVQGEPHFQVGTDDGIVIGDITWPDKGPYEGLGNGYYLDPNAYFHQSFWIPNPETDNEYGDANTNVLPLSIGSTIIGTRYCVPFEKDSGDIYFDDGVTADKPEGNWDTNEYGFRPPQAGYYDLFAGFFIEWEIWCEADGNTNYDFYDGTAAGNSATEVTFEIYGSVNNINSGRDITDGTKNTISITLNRPRNISSGYHKETMYIKGNVLEDFYLTEEDLAYVHMSVRGNGPNFLTNDTQQEGWLGQVRYKITVTPGSDTLLSNKTRVYNRLKSGKLNTGAVASLTENSVLRLNAFIPKDIKQIDLFKDLIKRYNLYIRKDPDNPNKLLLDTRDQYYIEGFNYPVLDWTDKLDNNREQKINLLQELQTKRINFTYKSDSDDYNEAWQKSVLETYGTKKIEFDNFFAKGEKNIESIFAPSPLFYDTLEGFGPTKVVPAINTRQPKNKIRILQWGGMKDTFGSIQYNSGEADPVTSLSKRRFWKFKFNFSVDGTYGYVNFKKYPYAGHFDDPVFPTTDISFGRLPYTYYDALTNMTDANLYNMYWRNYMEQIGKGKLLTAYFDLDEGDINDIRDKLNRRIWVKESWYVINRINDFDPTNSEPTQVELLKIDDPRPFNPSLIQNGNSAPGGHDLGNKIFPDPGGKFDNLPDILVNFLPFDEEHGGKTKGTEWGEKQKDILFGGGPVDTLGPGDTGTPIYEGEKEVGVVNVGAADIAMKDPEKADVTGLFPGGGAGTDGFKGTPGQGGEEKFQDGAMHVLDGGRNELRDKFAEINLHIADGGQPKADGSPSLADPFPDGEWSFVKSWDGSTESSDWDNAEPMRKSPTHERVIVKLREKSKDRRVAGKIKEVQVNRPIADKRWLESFANSPLRVDRVSVNGIVTETPKLPPKGF
jgi:hypothetical protein